MLDIKTLLILIPGLPLAACLITALLGAKVLRERSHLPVVASILGSFVCSLLLLLAVTKMTGAADSQSIGVERVCTLWNWADVTEAYQPRGASRDFKIDVALRADPLTAVMLAMVTFISSLVAVSSIGYMHGDPGYWRF